ncbi:MAG: hypothetical protein N4A57_02715 [Anaeromicrobium sp.]|jgi:hypothetical protein|uniref:hypothetical protein n=1 Tax=Anaeromicrobium sp. TaxID=1929132 RepID=UPI0025CEEC09|nr:hypothetical protein [Anaeromicrobium sp.]MCT4593173.1 hypothetical protein [Anaeromicrobium sp.]
MRQSSRTIFTQQKDIREIAGDHYVNINIKVAKTDVQAKLVEGVLPAGTAVDSTGRPANGTTSHGVTFADVDFNDSMGTEILPVMIHGFVNKARLKEYSSEDLTAEAITAMNMIKFL